MKILPYISRLLSDNGSEEAIDDGLYYKKEREEVFSSQPSSPHSSHSSTVKDPSR